MWRERALKIVLVVVGLLFLAGVYPLWRLQLDPSEQMLGGVYAALCPASSILSGQRQLEFPILFERYQQQSGLWAVGREENLLLVFLPFHRPAFSTALGRRIVIVEIITMVSWLPRTPSRRPDSSWLAPCGNSGCSVPGLSSDGPNDRSRPLWSSRL